MHAAFFFTPEDGLSLCLHCDLVVHPTVGTGWDRFMICEQSVRLPKYVVEGKCGGCAGKCKQCRKRLEEAQSRCAANGGVSASPCVTPMQGRQGAAAGASSSDQSCNVPPRRAASNGGGEEGGGTEPGAGRAVGIIKGEGIAAAATAAAVADDPRNKLKSTIKKRERRQRQFSLQLCDDATSDTVEDRRHGGAEAEAEQAEAETAGKRRNKKTMKIGIHNAKEATATAAGGVSEVEPALVVFRSSN